MFNDEVLPRLQRKLPPAFIATRELRVALLPESEADARVAPIYTAHKDVETTILAPVGEVQLHLKARGKSREEAQEKVDALAEELEDELGDNVFSSRGESLEQIVGYFLDMRGSYVAVGEPCIGGPMEDRPDWDEGWFRENLGRV